MVLFLPPGLSVTRVGPADAEPLGALFEVFGADPEVARFFHPHPLTRAFAAQLCERAGRSLDRYYLTRYRGRAVAYHRLSGWDEGYTVPSFGLCVHPALRGVGLGHVLLAQAVLDSRDAGAPALRLTVYKENRRALHVYEKFGFVFEEKNEREWMGRLDLASTLPPAVRAVDIAALDAWIEREASGRATSRDRAA